MMVGRDTAPRSTGDRPGIRTVCSLPLRDVPVDGVVRAGDLVFCRSEDRAVSRLIAAMDGYWTHVALATGGDRVAHASALGVGRSTIGELRHHYGDGMAVASLDVDDDARGRAVDWALDKAGDELRPPADYAWDNLGTTFALLLRARERGAVERLPGLDAETVREIEGLDGLESFREAHGTCSGFVYAAYAEGGASAPVIVPAPGLTVADGELRFPEGPSAGEVLAAVDGLEGTVGDTLASWGRLVGIAVSVARGWTAVRLGDPSVPIEDGVTPGDLWCSPDVVRRGHLTDEDQAAALEDVDDCPCPRHHGR